MASSARERHAVTWVTRRAVSGRRGEATRLAKRVAALDDDLETIIKAHGRDAQTEPRWALLEQPGIGPVTAAVALTSWSHLGRVCSEAAFASLADANLIPASFDNTLRHRLNRAGDRRLNRARPLAVVTRMRMDPSAACVERTAEGRTTEETRRCLKRYLSRQTHRQLNAAGSNPCAA